MTPNSALQGTRRRRTPELAQWADARGLLPQTSAHRGGGSHAPHDGAAGAAHHAPGAARRSGKRACLGACGSAAAPLGHGMNGHMKKAIALIALLAVAIVGYVAAGPYITLHQIKSAVQQQNSEKLSENIDFPTLRQNLKEQLNAVIMKETVSQMKDNPVAALALGFASKLVDGMVDSFVSPSGLANLMEGKKPQQKAPTETSESTPSQSTDEKREPFKDARYTYDSTSKFSVWVKANEGEETRFVLTRDGLKWKLSNNVIPIKK